MTKHQSKLKKTVQTFRYAADFPKHCRFQMLQFTSFRFRHKPGLRAYDA